MNVKLIVSGVSGIFNILNTRSLDLALTDSSIPKKKSQLSTAQKLTPKYLVSINFHDKRPSAIPTSGNGSHVTKHGCYLGRRVYPDAVRTVKTDSEVKGMDGSES